MSADNVGSQQMHVVRRLLRQTPKAEIIMGKNTMIKYVIRKYAIETGDAAFNKLADACRAFPPSRTLLTVLSHHVVRPPFSSQHAHRCLPYVPTRLQTSSRLLGAVASACLTDSGSTLIPNAYIRAERRARVHQRGHEAGQGDAREEQGASLAVGVE